MTTLEAHQYLDKTYCLSNGNVFHEYLLLGALSGVPLSDSAINRTGEILYVRNGMMMSGRDELVNSNNGFKFLDKPSLPKLKELLTKL